MHFYWNIGCTPFYKGICRSSIENSLNKRKQSEELCAKAEEWNMASGDVTQEVADDFVSI